VISNNPEIKGGANSLLKEKSENNPSIK